MSSFVKHRLCTGGICLQIDFWKEKRCDDDFCIYSHENDDRPIFEERDTDQEAKLDRRARARECK